MNKLDYNSRDVPDNYFCYVCGVQGCKMWRQYNTFLDHIELMCVDCARKDQNVKYRVNQDGKHRSEHTGMIDQIEFLVPAVPDEENETFWGYTSVPESGVQWWRRLPLRA